MSRKFEVSVGYWFGSISFSTQSNTYAYLEQNDISYEALKVVLSKCLSNGMRATFRSDDNALCVKALLTTYHKKVYVLEQYIKSADALREIISLYDLEVLDCLDLANILMQIKDVKLFEKRPETPEAALEVGIADFLDLYQLKDGRYVNIATLPALEMYSADELYKIEAEVY